MEWWLWGIAATLSAATVVTTVVLFTRPQGASSPGPTAGVGTMGLTVRF